MHVHFFKKFFMKVTLFQLILGVKMLEIRLNLMLFLIKNKIFGGNAFSEELTHVFVTT